MGCCGRREEGKLEYTQKWDYITLSDFRATSAWNSVAYIWVWIMFLTTFAVYAVDSFTAVNLLAYDRWSSQIQPAVPFKYTKWIFAGCIILAFALAFYEWARAIRVMKRGGIAESYMDPIAVSLQSMRGSGWRRFLLFTELTKSKKGADYVALFTYFNFKTAIRVIIAEGPRQAINAMSLYAVMNADLVPHGPTPNPAFVQFWVNLGSMTNDKKLQAAVFFGMLYSLVIWVISAISLAIAGLLWLFFLWHYVPSRDGSLTKYCRRKIDRRLEKILERKITAAVEQQQKQQQKAEIKAELARQRTGGTPPPLPPKLNRAPTLPQIGQSPGMIQDNKFDLALERHNTTSSQSTLPLYSSRPPTRNGSLDQMQRQPTLPDLGAERPAMPSRSATQNTAFTDTSYASDAPLLANAGFRNEGGRASPAPSLPQQAYGGQGPFGRPLPGRSMTPGSMHGPPARQPPPPSGWPGSGPRPYSPAANRNPMSGPPRPLGPPARSQTAFEFENNQRAASPFGNRGPFAGPQVPPQRSNTVDNMRSGPTPQPPYGGPGPLPSFSRPLEAHRKPTPASFNRPFTPNVPRDNSLPPSPAETAESYEMTAGAQSSTTQNSSGGYVAFNPSRTAATSPPVNLQPGPQRNVTISAAGPDEGDSYFGSVASEQRVTGPISSRNTMLDIIDQYGSSARSSAFSDFPQTPTSQTGPSTPGETHLRPPQPHH